ncbi:MAG: polyketide cyclase/dehydrase [Frankiales bacterium]|nr:polyketide cyclase/dehydrase [Frankiales bacterium]
MATVSASIHAPADAVFAVLADGWSYSNWVVGTSHMRAVEAGWPAVGAKLHHAAGVWPMVTRDETVVEECEPGRRLVLNAKGRPMGEARVIIELEAMGDDTRVTMTETPIAGPGKWSNNPLSEAALGRRNKEALARLTAMAERRTEPSD